MKSSYQDIWDDIYREGYYTYYPNENIVRFIFTRLPHKKEERWNIRVLDLGCGTGNNTWMLAKEGFDTYAFDGSAVALQLNQKRLDQMGLSAHLSQGDFLNLTYDKDYFDVVIDDAAIEANGSQNILPIFKEVRRILKKSGTYFGRLISTETNSNYPLRRKRILHFFELEEIKALMKDCDFSDAKIGYITIGDNDSGTFVKFWLVEAK